MTRARHAVSVPFCLNGAVRASWLPHMSGLKRWLSLFPCRVNSPVAREGAG
jgi:hypothetical protein